MPRSWSSSPAAGVEVNALVFPYFRDGELVNVKYRGEDKSFWQIKGAEKIMFGLDDIAGAREIVIVEGEMDKLALEQAGIRPSSPYPTELLGRFATAPRPIRARTASSSTCGTAGRRSTR